MKATDLHVPGHWECPQCGFQQIRSILSPQGIGTDTRPHLEPCPNDGQDMVPLTWKRACEHQEKLITQLLQRDTENSEAIAELNERGSSHLISMLNLAGRLTRELAASKQLHTLQRQIGIWAALTFPHQTAASKLAHLRDEVTELEQAPADGEEMADIAILLFALAELAGCDLLAEIQKKFQKNKARQWGQPDARGVVKHIDPEPTA